MSQFDTKKEIDNNLLDIPMIIVRDFVIMPGTSVHFDIQEETCVKAIHHAMEYNEPLLVIMAKHQMEQGKAQLNELQAIGTYVKVRQVLNLPKGVIRVVLFGLKRAVIDSFKFENGYYRTKYHVIESVQDDITTHKKEAVIRTLKDILKQCEKRKLLRTPIVGDAFDGELNLDTFVDMIAEMVSVPVASKQALLETLNLSERVETLLRILINEIAVCDIREDLSNKLKDCVSQNQKEYVLREQMKVIRKELGEGDTKDDGERYREMLDEAHPTKEVRDKIQKEIKRLEGLSASSSESAVLRNYIETVLDFPWEKESIDNDNLQSAMEQLEKDHYGLVKVKERIIDYLAVRMLSGRKDAPILCLVGPPGTGKTSIAKSIAAALNKEYGRIALGGVRDEAEIRGHRKTYIGAMPGRVACVISKIGVKNPLILLDEIDKTSGDHRGDVSAALLEVLDSEQNEKFVDHYFEVPIDLSNVLFVATANDISDIPIPLRDRMEIVEVNSYTEAEKYQIAKQHLIAKQLKKNGLTKKQFKLTDESIYKLIRSYTKEAGVRNLERMIGHLMQKAARGIVTGEFKSVTVNISKLQQMLGVEKYSIAAYDLEDKIGVVTGLAWTKVGGDTLNVEVNILEGKGGLMLTGNLGDVMKESAQIALSYVRTLPDIKQLPNEYFENHMIHVHVPEGATPKDGPSAGITITLAIYSALCNRCVSGKIAMTGEITLKGNVLAIGGLKEKLLAAKNAGKTKVFVPWSNQKNVAELEPEIIEGIEILYVKNMAEVMEQAIVKQKISLKTKSVKG